MTDTTLPDDCWSEILRHVNVDGWLAVSCVCKAFKLMTEGKMVKKSSMPEFAPNFAEPELSFRQIALICRDAPRSERELLICSNRDRTKAAWRRLHECAAHGHKRAMLVVSCWFHNTSYTYRGNVDCVPLLDDSTTDAYLLAEGSILAQAVLTWYSRKHSRSYREAFAIIETAGADSTDYLMQYQYACFNIYQQHIWCGKAKLLEMLQQSSDAGYYPAVEALAASLMGGPFRPIDFAKAGKVYRRLVKYGAIKDQWGVDAASYASVCDSMISQGRRNWNPVV